MVIVEVMVPSIMLSSAPVTVTVCAVSQFAGVNVSGLLTVASLVSSDVTVNTTSDVGWASRTTVNVSVLPASVTSVDPSSSSTVNPATSSSVVSTETVRSATASKSSSELASSTATVIVEVMVPSTMSSSAPVTVTVCGVSQFADVKVTLAGTVASPVSSDVIVRTTSVAGSASRTTVNVSVVPDSPTSIDPSSSSIVNPATSSSVVDTETV